jgi:hypothetical protein
MSLATLARQQGGAREAQELPVRDDEKREGDVLAIRASFGFGSVN